MSRLNSKEVILNIVGSINNETLSLDDYDVSDPKPVSDDHNTEVLIRPKLGSGLYGVRLLKYNRLNLAEFPVTFVRRRNAVTLRNLLPRIETVGTFGFVLNTAIDSVLDKLLYAGIPIEDVYDYYLPAIDQNNNAIVPLTAAPNSYLFYGHSTLSLLDSVTVNVPSESSVPSGTQVPGTVVSGISQTLSDLSDRTLEDGSPRILENLLGRNTEYVMETYSNIRTIQSGDHRILENNTIRNIEYINTMTSGISQSLQDNGVRVLEFIMI